MLQRVAQIGAKRKTLIIQLGAKFFKTSIFGSCSVNSKKVTPQTYQDASAAIIP
jgi:hypothetical protein